MGSLKLQDLECHALCQAIYSVDRVSDIPPQTVVELNSHGKQLMDVMKSLELGTLNGKGKANFTYILSLVHSFVDYCIWI